jgi:4-aminobutyrate aminotransferase-like enzyme
MKLKFHPPLSFQKENIQATLEELEKTIVSGIEA